MRKATVDINVIKQQINDLCGKILNVRINPGRNKISEIEAIIDKIYPSLFTLKYQDENGQTKHSSYSYSDVMCGKVTFLV